MNDVEIIVQTELSIVEAADADIVVAERDVIEILTAGIQGPAGRDGASGGGNVVWTAGESLSGERVVYADSATVVKYADKDTPAHEFLVAGMTTTAAANGDSVTVQSQGLMTEVSWNWTVGQPVFLGNNGMLTQTAPTTGFVLEIGVAIAVTVILINIGVSIELA